MLFTIHKAKKFNSSFVYPRCLFENSVKYTFLYTKCFTLHFNETPINYVQVLHSLLKM